MIRRLYYDNRLQWCSVTSGSAAWLQLTMAIKAICDETSTTNVKSVFSARFGFIFKNVMDGQPLPPKRKREKDTDTSCASCGWFAPYWIMKVATEDFCMLQSIDSAVTIPNDLIWDRNLIDGASPSSGTTSYMSVWKFAHLHDFFFFF